MVSVFVSMSACVAVSLAGYEIVAYYMRSTENKSRTWDPVPTLTMRTRASEVSVENINYKSNLFSGYNRYFRYQRNMSLKGYNMAQIKIIMADVMRLRGLLMLITSVFNKLKFNYI